MTQTRWWWVRHAPVTETGGRIYGATDPNADIDDRAAFQALDGMLPRKAEWVTSHLRRTVQTASAIAAAGGRRIAPLREPALGEQNFGAWHGKTHEEVRSLPSGHRFWLAAADHRPPGGESFAELCLRTRAAIARLNEVWAGRDIVAVAHGGTIRAALGLALDLEPKGALRFATDNLSLTQIEHYAGDDRQPEGWRVACLNRPPILATPPPAR